jgi:hypothetical protein
MLYPFTILDSGGVCGSEIESSSCVSGKGGPEMEAHCGKETSYFAEAIEIVDALE